MTLEKKLLNANKKTPDTQQKELEANMDTIIYENKKALLELTTSAHIRETPIIKGKDAERFINRKNIVDKTIENRVKKLTEKTTSIN